jgi:hypothetical protein
MCRVTAYGNMKRALTKAICYRVVGLSVVFALASNAYFITSSYHNAIASFGTLALTMGATSLTFYIIVTLFVDRHLTSRRYWLWFGLQFVITLIAIMYTASSRSLWCCVQPPVRALLCDTLSDVVDAFKAHDITAWICMGSLLAAQRDRGQPLPWEHDLDLCILEQHVNKALDVLNRMHDAPHGMILPNGQQLKKIDFQYLPATRRYVPFRVYADATDYGRQLARQAEIFIDIYAYCPGTSYSLITHSYAFSCDVMVLYGG